MVSASVSNAFEAGETPNIESVNDAISVMKYVATRSEQNIVVIDEFDQLQGTGEKSKFATLIKQVADQEINVKIIFCGIGTSLEELLGSHLSADRYINPIFLERLPFDARWEILEATAKLLNAEIPREQVIRISHIRDGFPYYVHLIGEHIF